MQLDPISDREFVRFQQIFHRLAGIFLEDRKKSLVEARLIKRIKSLGLASYGDYLGYLENDRSGSEQQTLVDMLTTNETSFFREINHFEYLRETLLPRYAREPMLRVWSAGSSIGAEAYSVAFVLAENRAPGSWEIVGTDINAQVIETAREALYPMDMARTIPPEYLKKYCLKGVRSQAGNFLIGPELRRGVRFQTLNLVDIGQFRGAFHIVFLRNTLIYFENEVKQKIIENILPLLIKGGYLIVGHSETLYNLSTGLFLEVPTIYKKT